MPDPTFAQQMVTKLQAMLLANAGLESVMIDGIATKFSDLEAKLAYWQSKVDAEQGTRSRVTSINLGGF